jgi:hypothetical protein
VNVTIGSILASSWFQYGFVLVAIVSAAADKLDVIKNAGKNALSWAKSKVPGGSTTSVVVADKKACESRRLTLVGLRHTASEIKDVTARNEALAICDKVDELAAKLYAEAA